MNTPDENDFNIPDFEFKPIGDYKLNLDIIEHAISHLVERVYGVPPDQILAFRDEFDDSKVIVNAVIVLPTQIDNFDIKIDFGDENNGQE